MGYKNVGHGVAGLVDKTVSAVHTAQQTSDDEVAFDGRGAGLYAEYTVTLAGAPTGYDVRAAVDGSLDGTTWHELVRFIDVTNALANSGTFIVRIHPGAAPASVALQTVPDLDSNAAAAAVIRDGALPVKYRARYEVKTLSGGTSPTVRQIVRLARR